MRRLVSILLATILVTACGEDAGDKERPPPRGTALAETAAVGWASTGSGGYAVGQEIVVAFVALENVDGEPVILREATPESLTGSPEVGEVRSIEVAPRGPAVRPLIPLGAFQTYPPARATAPDDRRGPRCGVQPLSSVGGYRLVPSRGGSEFAVLAIRVRFNGPGLFELRGLRVRYTSRGKDFVQSFDFTARVEVRTGPARPLSESERRCAHVTTVLGSPRSR